MELVLPEQVSASGGVIEGKIRFESMHTQTVKSVKLTLSEKYSRGRFKNKLTDLYKIAESEQQENIVVPDGEPVEIDFALPFTIIKSDMDELADKNFVLRKLVGAAKKVKNVSSEYTLEAEAVIEGTALNPFDKQVVNIV